MTKYREILRLSGLWLSQQNIADNCNVSKKTVNRVLKSATTTSVFQEFYINMLLSNLSSLIKNQANEEIEISAKSSNKYRYQANRAFIIGFMKRLLPKILCTISTIDEINRLYSEAVRNRSQIMPGRTFKRKKNKAKGRTHFKGLWKKNSPPKKKEQEFIMNSRSFFLL